MSKKKKKNDDERLENYFEVFMRNYRNVPGFRMIIKLCVPFIFFLIIILVVAIHGPVEQNYPNLDSNVDETIEKKLSYKEMLDNVYQGESKFDINTTINEVEYLIHVNYENEILTGYVESVDSIHNFQIVKDDIYELKMNDQFINNELLSDFNLDYIIPSKLITYIESLTASTKSVEDGNIVYNYHEENLDIYVTTNDYKVISILIKSTNEYNIQYK